MAIVMECDSCGAICKVASSKCIMIFGINDLGSKTNPEFKRYICQSCYEKVKEVLKNGKQADT